MKEHRPAAIRAWLTELCDRGARASIIIAAERLRAFFTGVENGVLIVDAVAPAHLKAPPAGGQETLVEFRDARKTGLCRFVTHCRTVEALAPGRLLLSLDLPAEIGWSDQRRHTRVRVAPSDLQAAIWTGRVRRPARVLEISGGGAKMHIAPHNLRLGEATPGTEFVIQFSGPVVEPLPRGRREAPAIVRRVVRDEPPWVLAVELIRAPQALVDALAQYTRQHLAER